MEDSIPTTPKQKSNIISSEKSSEKQVLTTPKRRNTGTMTPDNGNLDSIKERLKQIQQQDAQQKAIRNKSNSS